jgi:acetylornithine deacetylase/succinyl-diaminopimelate desuccinylase-like protein
MDFSGTNSVELLQRLVRFNTVNPPGNERPAQELLAQVLGAAGFACELLGRTPERPNLVARLTGDEDGPTLCLLSHVDTVLATPSEWTHDPWSGDLADGSVWGRGTLDMKGQTAAEVAAACTLAAGGWRPARGALLVVVVVDEETGGSEGAQWLTATHPDKVRCDYLVNEGGGGVLDYGGRRLVGLGCGEKGIFRFALHTDGVAAHASMPRLGDNALLKLAPLLARLAERQPSYDLTALPRAFLESVGALPSGGEDVAAALERIRATDPRLVPIVEPMLGVSLAPTKAFGSEKINVIPSQARIQVDCRVPPGLGRAQALAAVQEIVGRDGYRLEWNGGGGGQQLAVRLAARRLYLRMGRAARSAGHGRAGDPSGIHRLAQLPRRVPRVPRVRVLSAERHDGARDRSAGARRRRADRRARPRVRDGLLRRSDARDAGLKAHAAH